MGGHTALSQLEQRSKEIRESHNSGNIDDDDEDKEKPSTSVITYPILRETVGKQQNWFYGTNSGSLPSMTLSDVFHPLMMTMTMKQKLHTG